MPVLEIKALPQPFGVDVRAVASAVCREVAEAAGVPASKVWATWQTLQPGHFVEGETSADVQPRATHPPVVNLIAFDGRSEETVHAMIEAAVRALVRELGLEPGNVFLTYTEARKGRVYTGGQIRS